ncbi:MAG TPA: LpqB family beta-propeller domain-containing protein [Motilibacterales bacterium]|nr:LpqB family beta-propeller domain-containing protein [Motilibacterales bacterium]
MRRALRPARSRAVLSAMVAAGCLALAACTAVPTSGPIEQGPVVDAGDSTQFIRVIAAPPSVGASPTEIVRGFLEANASLESDHAIARRYLTPAASGIWDPNASTTVYQQSSLMLSEGSGGEITAGLSINNRLDSAGSLDPVDPAAKEEIDFDLEQVVDGASGGPQWRIVDPPPGILISDTDLRRAYRQYQVHHPSARADVLVPDGRMLPVVGPSLPTALAERVLAGPADWLAPGVRTGAPPGTELALGAVPVSNGVAEVELTDQALAATDVQRQDLAAQLTWTLTQLPGVTGVRLLVGGDRYDVPGAPEVMDRAVWQERSPDSVTTGATADGRFPYYVLEGTEVVRVSDESRTAVAIGVPGAGTLIDLGVSLDQRTASAVEPDRRALWILPLDRGVSEQRVRGTRIGGASFDTDGRAWFTDDGEVKSLSPNGLPQAVAVQPEFGDAPITAVHLARDGTRVVLVVDGILYLGVIQPSTTGLSIGSVRRIATTVARVRDVAWRNSVTLDVLGETQASSLQVLRIGVGTGEAQPLGTPPEPREVAGAPGSATLVAGEDDLLFANVGLQWRAQGAARSVAYPG